MTILTIEINMANYLSSIGHERVRIKEPGYWYKFPLRDEKSSSFKVNRSLNRWFDFEDGKYGNLVNFGTLYHQCGIGDFLHKMDSTGNFIDQYQRIGDNSFSKDEENNRIKIPLVNEISAYVLVNYLRSRKVSDNIADKYCSEARHKTGEKIHYVLSFKNNSGGSEFRNEYFKGSISPKDITLIENQAKNMAIFEDFFNFLSYPTLYYKEEKNLRNFLILNSTSFFDKNIPRMLEHNCVYIYPGNDKTGQNCRQQALKIDKEKFQDDRRLYQ